MQLEERIAAFKNVEACVVFQSGFAANAGTVSAILTPEDHIICDELNHASIIDGCRLSQAKIHVFPHKDVAAAAEDSGGTGFGPGPQAVDHRRRVLDGWRYRRRCPALSDAAERHGAIMMVDDAHSSGVLGRNGRGTIDHFGLDGRVHIQVGTLSKAIGVLGGYVCGSRDLIEFLYHRARPFLFSTSHPPAVAAACLAAFDVLEAGARANRAALGEHAVFQSGVEVRRIQYGDQRDADHAGDRGRCGAGASTVARTVRRRRPGDGHRVPDGGEGQGARADDRDVHSYEGGVGYGAGGFWEGREEAGDPGRVARGEFDAETRRRGVRTRRRGKSQNERGDSGGLVGLRTERARYEKHVPEI